MMMTKRCVPVWRGRTRWRERGHAPDPRAAAGSHIDHTVGPAAAVLKVFEAVDRLELPLLTAANGDLPGYLAMLAQLEEVLTFLSNNCRLAA
jgi:exocyst complex component 7